ncbi:glycosyl hydrolase family 65 protein [Enterococcus canintestini]|uniref:glycoside hydrolase family 65 protein n=1 Tax=Enterococcus canintestini TaxID=317010 RepID=UPI002890828D|nr:glycosyl hydrolase family 65 protein [Enterococcus canintestini]MDT2739826.1 glycosyl hydrolase family 65 protein [Enterococcus canintestini]
MKLAEINTQKKNWQVTLPTETLTVTGTVNEKAQQLVAILTDTAINGGMITGDEVILDQPDGIFELSQWLTEKLNLPFVLATDNFTKAAEDLKWQVTYHGYRPGKDEYSVESLLTVGNGFMGLRGTMPEMEISDDHYPATYLASLYNTAASIVADQTIYNEDFVNAPNLQKIYLIVDDEKIAFEKDQIKKLTRTLHMKTGLFTANAIVTTKSGKDIAIKVKKIANMEHTAQYSIHYAFVPLNFSGTVTVVTEADGDVYNYNVARYRSLTKDHLDITRLHATGKKALLVAKTKASKITVTQYSELFSDTLDLTQLENTQTDKVIRQKITFSAAKNTWYSLDKAVSVAQRRKEESPLEIDLNTITLPDFKTSAAQSAIAWQILWDKAAITVSGDLMSQKLLNLHTYHLLCSASPNGNKGLDASITARGLHGEAYRGHIFWDELFILPFYIIHFPKTAREILLYRYRRLKAAKIDAKKAGYKGAMFPWQSGLEGTEQSQELHLNPISGKWKEDHSRLQRHVSLAIAYNIWQYFNNAQDEDFMKQYGLELMLEIAHFWESAAIWDEKLERYSIDHVMGPDEFHESYPNSEKGGLKNNAYTNMMVVWLFEEIARLQEVLPTDFAATVEKSGISAETLHRMKDIKNKLALEINEDGIIAQFEGYFNLKDLDWDYYQEKYGNVYRMDRILNAEGHSADEYKVAKQADSLMIFYNFPQQKVDEILQDLNYDLPADYVTKNLAYYLARTSHGSTLSRVVHAQLAAMVDDQDLAWQLYKEALYSDYRDIQGGTTAEGIHAGVMAATLYIPLTTFAGLDIRQEVLNLTPNLPKAWESLSYKLKIRGVHFAIALTHRKIIITADETITIKVCGKPVTLEAGVKTAVSY